MAALPIRWFWSVCGTLALLMAVAGAVLPFLPSTPFLLVAAYAYSKSSPRLYGWLRAHPRFRQPLEAWLRHRAIPRRTKRLAVSTLPISLVPTVVTGGSSGFVVLQMAILAVIAFVIVSRPNPPDA